MSEPNRRIDLDRTESEPRIRRSWWIFAGALVCIAVLVIARLLAGGAGFLDRALVVLVAVAGVAAIRHRAAVDELETGRRAEADSFARILSGLSRSVSEDAIVRAIVEELATATGADHVVVARRRPEARALQATLISARPGVPSSTTLLPMFDFDDPPARVSRRMAVPIDGEALVAAGVGAARSSGWRSRREAAFDGFAAMAAHGPEPELDAAQAVADRIGDHVRSAYGLAHLLAAPLRGAEGVMGAIVLSRRSGDEWSETARRLVTGAAEEASAALSRAGSHRAAELQASTDALTGLPNRRYFDEFCGLVARRRRAEDAVGALMIDIDRFKVLNDTYGHAAGDKVLKAVGGAIVDAVRDDDVPARYGGEEFVVLLRNPSGRIALDIGERVRRSVAALDLSRFGIPGVTVSVGAAVAERPDQPIAELVELADQALYRAKRAGRDRVVAA